MTEANKPLGVVLIALYSGFWGVISLPLGGCALVVGGQMLGGGGLRSVVAFAAFVLGLLWIAAAYGLWTRQPWARNLIAGIYIVSIPVNFIGIFPVLPGTRMSLANTLLQVAAIVVAAWIISYISKPETKAYFEGTPLPTRRFDEFERRKPH